MARVKWTVDDHRIAVYGYMEMLGKTKHGNAVEKKQYLKRMAKASGSRITEKSFSCKLQNISHVMMVEEGVYLKGYSPLEHVTSSQFELISELISEYRTIHEGQDEKSCNLEHASPDNPPSGNLFPKKRIGDSTLYDRNASIKQWILQKANGVCECCGCPAPFLTFEGQPYLEVHHVVPLCQQGTDSLENVVALCPNCHRELHYGLQRETKTEYLYKSISRLKKVC